MPLKNIEQLKEYKKKYYLNKNYFIKNLQFNLNYKFLPIKIILLNLLLLFDYFNKNCNFYFLKTNFFFQNF